MTNPHQAPFRARCWAWLVLGLMTAVSATVRAAHPPLPLGISEFAGRLTQLQGLLGVPREDGQVLEEINRALRDPGDSAEVAANRAAAATRLEAWVRDSSHRLTLDGTQLEATAAELHGRGPIRLAGDAGALLLAIRMGEGPVGFSVARADLSEPKGESSAVTVEAVGRGLTYALVGLDRVPQGRTTLLLEVNVADAAPLRMPLEVLVPPFGQLRVAVRSAETQGVAPAMVRLVWLTDGRARAPANAIDFGLQFDRQGRASGARAARLPGRAGEDFWAVPGPFQMALPPGRWQIGVRRGVEHEFVFDEVEIASGDTVERVFEPKRWVDMRRRGWWSGDDHVHCRLMSDDDATRLMAWVQAEDVHLANVVKMGDLHRTYFEQRGFGPDFRVRDGEYVLVPGQECPRTHDQIGHTLAMNISRMVRDVDQYFLYDTVFDAVHAQGGLSGYAHVNSGLFHVHRDMTLNVPRQKVDFVELIQFNHLGTELYYEFLNLGCKLTASAGSDVPWGGSIGEVRVYAWLGDQPFTADAWFAAFANGRTFTTSGPMIDLRVEDALPGDEIRVQPGKRVRVRARAWGDPRRTDSVRLELVHSGEVMATSTRGGAEAEATLEASVDPGDGGWLAARARASDGTSAHTTPVYLVKEGLRFWRYDLVPDLLAARRESLHQIEEMVAQAQRQAREGHLAPGDVTQSQLARQGDALLERVATARGLYDALEATYDREEALRKRSGDAR